VPEVVLVVPEVVVALLTPFHTDRALDEGALAKHVDFSVAVEHELRRFGA
jgi:dihydrodipicolinate synthase/N-acetylneuraminate lyase